MKRRELPQNKTTEKAVRGKDRGPPIPSKADGLRVGGAEVDVAYTTWERRGEKSLEEKANYDC